MFQKENKIPPASGFFNFSRHSLLLAASIILAVLLTDWLSYLCLLPRALAKTEAQIQRSLKSKINTFERNLDKYRYLPLTLAMDSDLQNYLLTPQRVPYTVISQKLRNISQVIGAAALSATSFMVARVGGGFCFKA